MVNYLFLKAKKNHFKNIKEKIDESINLIINCKTTDEICLFSNFGKVYILNCSKLKFGSIKGVAVSSYLNLKDNESKTSAIPRYIGFLVKRKIPDITKCVALEG